MPYASEVAREYFEMVSKNNWKLGFKGKPCYAARDYNKVNTVCTKSLNH